MCVTCPSPKVLDNVSQLLAPAYHRVAASGMLRDCIQQVYIPLLVWHSETGCSDGHTEAKSAEEMFHYHTHAHADYPNLVPLRIASQTHQVLYTQKSNLSAGSLSHPSLAWPHPFPLLRKGVWPRETRAIQQFAHA